MGNMTGLCVNEDDNVLCAIDWSLNKLNLLDKEYKLIKDITLPPYGSYKSIDYNYTNNMYYLLNGKENATSILIIDKNLTRIMKQTAILDAMFLMSIKLIKNKVYVCDSHWGRNKSRILIFDNQLNFIESFGETILYSPQDIFIDPYCNNFIYIPDYWDECVTIFALDDHTFIKKIRIYECPLYGLIVNNKMIINHSMKTLRVYDIVFL